MTATLSPLTKAPVRGDALWNPQAHMPSARAKRLVITGGDGAWLTTPDGKRVESTYDWPAFRANTYPRLKSGLQKKFPAVLWV